MTFDTSRTLPFSSVNRRSESHLFRQASPIRFVLVEDQERQTLLHEVIADGQTCLASADDHGSKLLITQ
jgi:hypothetical protein